jgi:hypothetical protein
VLVLDGAGRVRRRGGGQPRRADLLAQLDAVLEATT